MLEKFQMGDLFLSVFHSAVDENGSTGFISVYYDNYIPSISFTVYSATNTTSLVFTFNVIQAIVAEDTIISLHISGQPKPANFVLESARAVWSFVQILVANGVLKSDPECPVRWIPAAGVKPLDPVEWVYQSSKIGSSIRYLHYQSTQEMLRTSKGASFSAAAHRDKMESLIKTGRESKMFAKLGACVTRESLVNGGEESKRLQEYLIVRKQWKARIQLQNECKSRHNEAVEKLRKEVETAIESETTGNLIYNVLRTLITFAPEVGFVPEIVHIALFVGQVVLGGDVERDDDAAQSTLFWALYTVWFEFGQSVWYTDAAQAMESLIPEAKKLLSEVYPAVGYMVGYKNHAILREAVEPVVSMFTKLFSDRALLGRLWNVMTEKRSANVLHLCVLIGIVCFELPDLVETKVPDTGFVARVGISGYTPPSNDDFVALVAALSERVSVSKPQVEAMNLSFTLARPIVL